MKVKSPQHRMVQLRRKTQKIVIPKASWDLSNKQNCNLTNLNETFKSKNNSSKKSSLDKKISKKTLNTINNVWQSSFKKINKNQQSQHIRKQKSQEKKINIKKEKIKVYKQCSTHNRFVQKMNDISLKAKSNEQIRNLKVKYDQVLANPSIKNEQQKQNFNIMCQHLKFWISKCQSLQNMLYFMNKTPKLQVIQVESQIASRQSYQKQKSDYWNSQQVSECSYIVDPKQQIKMKPIKKQLKEKLQLNFSKVEHVRKKQYI